jgi:tetratricopeptide (TPR) repeat protein
LTSDHGEGLGDHGESTHGYFVYQSTVSVPLIFHWPSSAQSFPVRVNEPVSLLDLAPTILQFLGVPIPPEFQGRSLLATLNGKSSGRKEFIHSESLFGHRHFDVSALESIREGQFKYIAAPRPELYDLAHDPGELHNIYDQQKSVALVLRGDMLSFRARYRHASAAPGEALDSDTVERLRSLGYMSLSNYRSAPSESGPDPKDRIVQYEQFGRASTLGSQGHLLQAIALLEGLLAKEPSVLDAHLTLGLDLQKLGKHAEAMKSFQEIIKRDPLNSVAHFNLAVSYFALHQQKEAAKECELALAISPAYTRAEELLATICLKEKEYEQARSHFMHILQVVPDDYDALYNLGVMATLERDWAEAEHRLRSALQADPASSQAHNVLGSVCFRKGDLTCAAEEFNDAIHLEPKFAWAHYNLGLVYRQEKKQGDAEREFREALAADPTLGPARSALMSMGVKAP